MASISNKSTQTPVFSLSPYLKPSTVNTGIKTTTPSNQGMTTYKNQFPKTPAPNTSVLNTSPTSPANYQAPTSYASIKAPTQNATTQGVTTRTQTNNYSGTQGSATTNQQPMSTMGSSSPKTTQTKGILQAPQGSYGNLNTRLTGASNANKTQTGLVSRLQDLSKSNASLGGEAENIRNLYGGKISEIGRLGAGAVAGNLSTGTNVVGSGNANLASNAASSRMTALAADEQAQLATIDRQLSANTNTGTALNNALTGANTQQAQQINALGQATGYAQPVQISPGNTLTSPMSGDTVAGGLGGYVNYNTAEQVMGLISQYPDSGYSYNQNLSPQQNLAQAQQAIQGSPTYQKGTFGAAGASNYLGGAGLQAASGLVEQKAGMQASASGAENNFNLLLDIAQKGGVNATNVPILNTLQQAVSRGAISSDAVVNFKGILQTVRAQYANILGGGTTTVESLQEAQSIIPDDVSLSALTTLSHNLKSDAQNRIQGFDEQIRSLSGGGYGNQGGGGGRVVQTSAGNIYTDW